MSGAVAEGLLLVDKPAGITSHDVVAWVRRATGTRKVGHAGTLDPLATGLLLVGVGRATRLLRYLSGLDKTYEGTGRLGAETDTLDSEGEVVKQVDRPEVAREDLESAMRALLGESAQTPPVYSAVKVGGVILHRAARRGQAVDPAPPRPIRVDAFELLRFEGSDFDFRVACSSGTYVRVLVASVGRTLDVGGHLTRLVRTGVGPFALADASSLEELGEPLPIEAAVAHLPTVRLDAEEARAAAVGRALGPAGVEGPYGVYAPDGSLVGVYRDAGARAMPEMVLAPAPGARGARPE
jgi:tRNA pseudouridine55 synthase